MLEMDLKEYFSARDWKLKLKDDLTAPDESDFEAILDEAAKMLYDEPVGTQLEVARLIIIKLHKGYDVYVLAGRYY